MDFLKKKQVSLKKGNFIDKKGIIIGQHDGILNYTIGQRKGLGIAVGKPAFVVHINNKNHDVVIGDNEDLFSDKTMCDNLFFTSTNSSDIPKFLYNKNVMCKIRYGAKPAEAKLEKNSRGVQIIFYEKQRAIAPGQWIVMYYENEVVGGGRII